MLTLSQRIKRSPLRVSYYALLAILFFLIGLGPFQKNEVFFYLAAAIIVIKGIIKRELTITPTLFLVLIYSLSYSVFDAISYGFAPISFVHNIAYPVAFYGIGNVLFASSKNDKIRTKLIIGLLAAMFSGFGMYLCVNYLYTSLYYGLYQTSTRYLLDASTGNFLSATGATPFSIPCVALLIALALAKPKSVWRWIAAVIGVAIFSWISFVLQNRLFFLALGIAILSSPILRILLLSEKPSKKIAIVYLSVFVTFLLGAAILLLNPSLLARIAPKGSFLYRLFSGGSNNARLALYDSFFRNAYKYPFGGLRNAQIIDKYGYTLVYVHNVWLDIYVNAGVVPCLTFAICTVLLVAWSIATTKGHKPNTLSFTISALSITFFVVFAIEPILSSSTYIFGLFFTFLALQEKGRLYSRSTLQTETEKHPFSLNSTNTTISYISNYLSIHQTSLHKEFINYFGDNYMFIATEPIGAEHRKYNEELSRASNYMTLGINEETDKRIFDHLEKSNIVIYGNCPDSILKKLKKSSKILIKCSELPYKNGPFAIYSLRNIVSQFRHFQPLFAGREPDAILTLSKYAGNQYNAFGIGINRTFTWGYWTEENPHLSYSDLPKTSDFDSPLIITYANRLIDWKHPETVLALSTALQNKAIPFHVYMYGDGPLYEWLQRKIEENGLSNCVTLSHAIPNEELIKQLEKSDILLSTSDIQEGWGATINEGMQCGCCVIASHYCGSAPVLIDNYRNGIIYDYHSPTQLENIVEYLLNNRDKLKSIQCCAFNDFKTKFSIATGFRKLLGLMEELRKGSVPEYIDPSISPLCERDITASPEEIQLEANKHYSEYIAKSGTPKTTEESGKKQIPFKATALISYAAILLNIVLGLTYVPWMVKELGKADYSIYTLVSSVVTLFTIDFGFSTAITKYIAKFRSENDLAKANGFAALAFKLYAAIDAVLLVILSVMFFLLPNIYPAYADRMGDMKICFAVFGLYTIISFGLTPLEGIISGNNKIAQIKIINLVVRVVDVAFTILCLLLHLGVVAYVFVLCMSNLLGKVLSIIFIKKGNLYGNKPDFKYKDRPLLLSILKFSIWIGVGSLAARYILSIQPTLMSSLIGDSAAVKSSIAVFGVATTVEGYYYLFANAINTLFIPLVTQMIHDGQEKRVSNELTIKNGKFQFFLLGLLLSGLIAFGGGFITRVWMDPSYANAYPAVILMCLPQLFICAEYVFYTYVVVKNRMKGFAISNIITLGLTVLFSVVFLKTWSEKYEIAVALAICLGKVIGSVFAMTLFYVKETGWNLKPFLLQVFLRGTLFLAVMSAFGLFLEKFYPTTGWASFLIKIAVFSIVYIAVALFALLTKKERHEIGTTISRKMQFLSYKITSIAGDNKKETSAITVDKYVL